MRSDFVEYHWRNHVPSIGPGDLAVVVFASLALLVSAVQNPSAIGLGQTRPTTAMDQSSGWSSADLVPGRPQCPGKAA